MAELLEFNHEDCEHFKTTVHKFGHCNEAEEHLRQQGYNPSAVSVMSYKYAATVWADDMSIKAGCPCFRPTQTALDNKAMELQYNDE